MATNAVFDSKEEYDEFIRLCNPMSTKAERYNEGKTQYSYLLDAPLAMEGLCRRFELGSKKYSRDNWKKGFDDNELIDSLLRHLMAIKKGEYVDAKDGGTHVDALVWNAVVLSEQIHASQNSLS